MGTQRLIRAPAEPRELRRVHVAVPGENRLDGGKYLRGDVEILERPSVAIDDSWIARKLAAQIIEQLRDPAQVSCHMFARLRGPAVAGRLSKRRKRQRDGAGFHQADHLVHSLLLAIRRRRAPLLNVHPSGEADSALSFGGPGDEPVRNQGAANELYERSGMRDRAAFYQRAAG